MFIIGNMTYFKKKSEKKKSEADKNKNKKLKYNKIFKLTVEKK